MAEKLTERFEMRLSEDGIARLDEWRRAESDLPSRAEAIRRLVDRGLAFDATYHAAVRLAKFSVKKIKKDSLAPDEIADFEETLGVLFYAMDQYSDSLAKQRADLLDEVRDVFGDDIAEYIVDEVARRRNKTNLK